jgi:hypothetical protein
MPWICASAGKNTSLNGVLEAFPAAVESRHKPGEQKSLPDRLKVRRKLDERRRNP